MSDTVRLGRWHLTSTPLTRYIKFLSLYHMHCGVLRADRHEESDTHRGYPIDEAGGRVPMALHSTGTCTSPADGADHAGPHHNNHQRKAAEQGRKRSPSTLNKNKQATPTGRPGGARRTIHQSTRRPTAHRPPTRSQDQPENPRRHLNHHLTVTQAT